MTIENENPLFDVKQAGIYTNTSERFIRRLVAERRITVTRLGKHVRISKSALDSWIATNTQTARQV